MRYLTELYQTRVREIELPDQINPGDFVPLKAETDLLNKTIICFYFVPFVESYSYDEELLDRDEMKKLLCSLSDELNVRVAKNSFSFEEVPLLFFFDPFVSPGTTTNNGRKLVLNTKINFELSKVENLSPSPVITAGKKLRYYIHYID